MAASLWTIASLLSLILWIQWAHVVGAHEARMSVKAPRHSHHSHHNHHKYQAHEAVKVAQKDIEQDVFASNHLVSFSWKDPLLQDQLWAGLPISARENFTGHSHLSKRAGRTIIPKVPRSLHCLGCLKKTIGGQMSINELTTEWLEAHIIPTEAQLRDKCVFYTGVKNSNRPNAPWLNSKENLSPTAASWACANGMYSLWSLFPGRDSNVAPNPPADTIKKRNFWEIDVPGSWLNHLAQTPSRFTYFENMSRAMANKCSGKVYIMSLEPENTKSFGTDPPSNPPGSADNNEHSIWNKVEVVALRDKGKTTQLIGIHAGTKRAYKLQLGDLSSDGPYTGIIPREIDEMLHKRDTCNGNLLYQSPGDDWFGTGRKSSS